MSVLKSSISCLVLLLWITAGCVPYHPAEAASPATPAGPTPGLINTQLAPGTGFTPAPVTVQTQPVPSADCMAVQGLIEEVTVESAAVGKDIQVKVYLPPCYDAKHAGGYPTLYLLHGQSYTQSHWVDLGVVEAADRMIINKIAEPFLIVLPREEYYLQDFPESHFGDALLKEVLPRIESSFASCRKRTCRAIGGISRGAVWAVKLGLTHPELFGEIGAHSLPSSPFSEYRLAELIKASNQEYPLRLYLDTGTLDSYGTETIKFETWLTKYRLPHTWVYLPGTHNDDYWRSQVENYLDWYTRGW